jgi:hypothetical protein
VATIKRLTPKLLEEICTRLKAGAFDQVAVESLGLSFEVFQGWLEKGQRTDGRAIYRRLFEAVREARAQAHFLAEMKLREEDTKVWLLHGPGRERWGSAARAGAAGAESREKIWKLCAVLLNALAAYTEARAAAAEAIAAAGLAESAKPQAAGGLP